MTRVRLRLRFSGCVRRRVVDKVVRQIHYCWPGGQRTLGPLLRAARPGRSTRLYCRLMSPGGHWPTTVLVWYGFSTYPYRDYRPHGKRGLPVLLLGEKADS